MKKTLLFIFSIILSAAYAAHPVKHWDQDIDKAAAAPIEGVSNVMYTVHFAR